MGTGTSFARELNPPDRSRIYIYIYMRSIPFFINNITLKHILIYINKWWATSKRCQMITKKPDSTKTQRQLQYVITTHNIIRSKPTTLCNNDQITFFDNFQLPYTFYLAQMLLHLCQINHILPRPFLFAMINTFEWPCQLVQQNTPTVTSQSFTNSASYSTQRRRHLYKT